ncbi:MAG: D-alanyl-D-alanine carboxypeptidase [Clostridia bacterium]|nr:D-alanyl-D-alanine carboxypeptidase [Clostridia bacterium]
MNKASRLRKKAHFLLHAASAIAALALLLLCCAAATAEYDPNHPENLEVDDLTCYSAILIQADSGEVIFEKNADATIYPASTTKIMTAYLGILLDDMDRRVTVSASAMDIGDDSTRIPLSIGEELALRDVIYATVLMSGNEGANVIAEAVGGNIYNFVALMNSAAESFGCSATHFANAHGLPDDNHYSTARDMARIARIAMQNDTFRDVVRQTTYRMPGDNIYKERNLTTNNRFMINSERNASTYYRYGIGVKTGYHSAAGYCYVGAAEKDGVTLISCVFRSTSDANRYTDTIKLMEYGFSQFRGVTIAELYRQNPKIVDIASYALDDSNLGKLTLALKEVSSEGSSTIVTSNSNIDYLSRHLSDITITEYTRAFSAPITEGEVMGTLTYYNDQGQATVYELLATRSITRREKLAPSIDDIIAYTEADPNPFPRFTFEFALLYIAAPIVALILVIKLFKRIFKRGKKKTKVQTVEPQERYYR